MTASFSLNVNRLAKYTPHTNVVNNDTDSTAECWPFVAQSVVAVSQMQKTVKRPSGPRASRNVNFCRETNTNAGI